MTVLAAAEGLSLSPGEVLLFGGVISVMIAVLGYMFKRYIDSNDELRKSVEGLTRVITQMELRMSEEYVKKVDHKEDLRDLEERLKTWPPPRHYSNLGDE